jgi:hypothetical protein
MLPSSEGCDHVVKDEDAIDALIAIYLDAKKTF